MIFHELHVEVPLAFVAHVTERVEDLFPVGDDVNTFKNMQGSL